MTRPRPVGPALAGAVDLSALKQPPPSADGGAATVTGGVEVTDANLEAEVLVRSNEVPVVVLLWTPRSAPSVELGNTLSALVDADRGTWALATVNIETAPRVAQMFGVQRIPTVIAVAAGQPVASFEGPQPPEQLRRWIDSLLNAVAGQLSGGPETGEEQVDPELALARAHLDNGDFDAARAAYQSILDAQPGHAEAKGAITQITFLQRATAQSPNAIALSDATPDDIDAAFAAADVQLLQQDAAGAYDRLIGLVKRTAGDDRTTVRTRLIELFDLFDPADPIVIAARRNLANALY